ncbi:MAG: type II toxin-antitoxin system PemK/MazF family toxin [Acidimicrobiia bacterium]|nr:type II toxin-antitoxin system PemK/MazF family toxin [Acidimicrobiia bacterium]
MELIRGDVVLSASSGDFGKPRPAVVVQSDLFNPTHSSVVICPLTTHLVDAPLFRIPIQAEHGNGLKQESQAMVDKVMGVRRDRIARKIGALGLSQMEAINRAMRVWLGLGSNTE